MAAPVQGAGFLRVIDRAMDASYCLFQPVVNVTFPITITAGQKTIPVSAASVWVPTPSLYVGAQLVCGLTGANLEVVTVTAVDEGVSFTATFANAHQAGEQILGATFPIRQQSGDQLLTQDEMLGYISVACNDFLTEVPLAYAVATITVDPSQQNTALPSDCQFPARIAYESYPLRETSQSALDATDYKWSVSPMSTPKAFFRDKIPTQNVGIWPRMGNKVNLECVYAQRQAQTLGWGDGFLLPDVFTSYILYRTLEFAFSKDGEIRNPALAKYFGSRFQTGLKISKMILGVINDTQAS